MNLFIEALVVGLLLSFFGVIIALVFRFFNGDQTDFGKWIINNLLIFFITGFTTHLILEFSGINKKYCTEGVACRTN